MGELDTIDIESRHLKMVKSVFARYLPYKQVGSPSINVDSLNHRNPSSIKESCIAFGI